MHETDNDVKKIIPAFSMAVHPFPILIDHCYTIEGSVRYAAGFSNVNRGAVRRLALISAEGQRAQVIRRQRHKLCPLGADKPVRIGLSQRVSSVMVCKEQGCPRAGCISREMAAVRSRWIEKARQQRIRRLEFVLSGQAQCTAVSAAQNRYAGASHLGHRIKMCCPMSESAINHSV